MTADIRPAPPEVRKALRLALIDAGCPISHAATVADLATFEHDEDGDYISVLGNRAVPDDVSTLDELAENLVDDNAERHDRTARGERGYQPLWPTPERAQRREGPVPFSAYGTRERVGADLSSPSGC